MKTMKKCICVIMSALMLLTSFALVSCNDKKPSGDLDYQVTVKDALGNVYSSGVIVRFMQNGEQVAMQAVDKDGKAVKTLAAGDYKVELAFTDSADGYHYGGDLTLTAEKTSLDIILARKITEKPSPVVVGGEEFDMFSVKEGCTYVELNPENRNYFVFVPSVAGKYEFSVADKAKAKIGYYGAPHFVQENSVAEVKDNSFTISVSASMIGTGDSGTSSYVIGIDSADSKAKSCVLGIKRIGDPEKTIEDEPWTIYKKTAELSDYILPVGASIKEFDLTAATDTYKLVYNKNDGFYHLDNENGPLVLVRLAEDSEYIASFATMLDCSGVSKYFYDKNGEFVKKESYSECLLEYIEYVDESEGVYPLTEDLKYIIQQRGEYVGWWNIESNGYIFKDIDGYNLTDINNEIAWLLMCCYID